MEHSPLGYKESDMIARLTLALEASQVASGKEPTRQRRRHKMQVRSLCQEDPLKEGMASHSSILVWRIPWTEEPGGL